MPNLKWSPWDTSVTGAVFSSNPLAWAKLYHNKEPAFLLEKAFKIVTQIINHLNIIDPYSPLLVQIGPNLLKNSPNGSTEDYLHLDKGV